MLNTLYIFVMLSKVLNIFYDWQGDDVVGIAKNFICRYFFFLQ